MKEPDRAPSQGLREAVRYLMLPIAPELEEDTVKLISGYLVSQGISMEDQPAALRLSLETWKSTGQIDSLLKRIVEIALSLGDDRLGTALHNSYLPLHDKMRDKSALTFDESSLLLVNLRLIEHLARKERMTAAKIAKVISAMDQRLRVSWREIEKVMTEIAVKPMLEYEEVQSLYAVDQELEEQLFADASIEEASRIVGEKGQALGFKGDLEELLLTLSEPNIAFVPYLQILLFQCVISEFYDHVLSVLYEFNPRGEAASWVFEQFADVGDAGNPVLNNAKAVDVLDMNWARSKTRPPSRLRPALALAQVIDGIDHIGFTGSHELAAWIRRWVLRYLRLQSKSKVMLPKELSIDQVRRVLDSVQLEQTRTSGIIDQRIVDAITSMQHPPDKGWRARGLGDSVNASNMSRKKLGDCDYQNPEGRKIVAYEAHGGTLTEVYVKEHLRTLKKIMPERTQEMLGIADLKDWEVAVVFVAHGFVDLPTRKEEIAGIDVKISFCLFKELLSTVKTKDVVLYKSFHEHVLKPISESRTPDSVRQRLLLLAGKA